VKILALIGSYRKHGNTAQIVDLILERLQEAASHRAHDALPGKALEIERIHLGDRDLGPCRGCRICFDRGEEQCPQKDDLLVIRAKMQEADGLILASPVYVDDVSGIVKNWIDRLAFVCHRPEFAGKCAYLIATVGSSPTSHTLRTLSLALNTWGFHVVGQAGFKMGALMTPEQTRASYLKTADKIARNLLDAIGSRAFERPSFLALMMFKIRQQNRQRAAKDSIDAAHWTDQGWIDPHRQFFIQPRTNPAIVWLARLAGAIIAPFVT
jgi:multimeric flavodoxin WrbA